MAIPVVFSFKGRQLRLRLIELFLKRQGGIALIHYENPACVRGFESWTTTFQHHMECNIVVFKCYRIPTIILNKSSNYVFSGLTGWNWRFSTLSSTWGCTSSQPVTHDTRRHPQVVFLFTTTFFKLCDREGSITLNDIFLINLSSQCIEKSENVPVWNWFFLTGLPLQWVLSGLHVEIAPQVKRVPTFS